MKQRDTALDIIRILACFMVVLMHSPMPSVNANGPFVAALNYFTMPCIGLFFMVSGALLLPVKMDYTAFLKRRLQKVVFPTLFWTLVYIGLNLLNDTASWQESVKYLISIPFSAQGHGVLWFMYTLVGLYLLAPIISAWLEKARKKDLQLVLGLWAVSICYPLLEPVVDINESISGTLYYFGGYAGYFLLGFYLKRFPKSISLVAASAIAAAGAIIIFAFKRLGIEIDFYRMFGYLSIFIVSMTAGLWIIVNYSCKYLRNIALQMWGQLSNLSFGVYLMHILVMRYWLWKLVWLKSISCYELQTIITAVITIAVSFTLCFLISKTAVGDYIIGYKEK